MIAFVDGDILKSNMQTLVNPVNTSGVMGAGLARRFRDAYPDMYRRYVRVCATGQFVPGKLLIYRGNNHWILNFPTKINPSDDSRIEYIEAGLDKLVSAWRDHGITSLAFPALGCGLGKLQWSEVQPLMTDYLATLPIPVEIYYPFRRKK